MKHGFLAPFGTFRSPEEGGAPVPPAPATEDNPPAAPTIEVDGVSYTPDEVKELVEGNMRQADYSRKTMQLAQERKILEAQRAKPVTSAPAPAPAAVPVPDPSGEYVDPNIQALGSKVDKLTDAMDAKNAADEKSAEESRVAEMNTQIDDVVDHAETLIKGDMGLATLKGVASEIQNHIYANNAVPSRAQVEAMVRNQHNDVAKRGGSLRVPEGDVSVAESTKEDLPVQATSAPDPAPTKGASVLDNRAMETELVDFVNANKDRPGFLTE